MPAESEQTLGQFGDPPKSIKPSPLSLSLGMKVPH